MRFDAYKPSGSRPTQDTLKSDGVGRAAAIYASRQPGDGTASPGSSADARSNVSPMGQLLRDLHGLKNNDPNAFSNVTATIADRLYEIAQTETTDVADHLHRLAYRFSLASQSGNLQPLRPPDQAHVRGLRGPAAYVQQRNHDEGTQELRLEVQSAIREVLLPFVDQARDDDASAGLGSSSLSSDEDATKFGDLSVVS